MRGATCVAFRSAMCCVICGDMCDAMFGVV